MKRVLLILAVSLSACHDNHDNSCKYIKSKETPELMFKTEHCRYYCLGKNGWGNCKNAVCECDSGFTADVSISW